MSAWVLLWVLLALAIYCIFFVRRAGECPLCKGTGHLPHEAYFDESGNRVVRNRECLRCGGTGRA